MSLCTTVNIYGGLLDLSDSGYVSADKTYACNDVFLACLKCMHLRTHAYVYGFKRAHTRGSRQYMGRMALHRSARGRHGRGDISVGMSRYAATHAHLHIRSSALTSPSATPLQRSRPRRRQLGLASTRTRTRRPAGRRGGRERRTGSPLVIGPIQTVDGRTPAASPSERHKTIHGPNAWVGAIARAESV